MKIATLAFTLALSLVFSTAGLAEEAEGEKIVHNLWKLFADGDVDALGAMMSPAFQSLHQNGSRTKEEELKLIANLNLSDYELSEVKTTHQGATLIITYFVEVGETIDGKELEKKKSARMDILDISAGEPVWLAHANLRALGK